MAVPGVITRGSMSPEREKAYKLKLEEVVLAGYKALQSGKSSLDAVEIAIRMMEDSPLFNAGKGAVLLLMERTSLTHRS
jgi:beta-aspartyl-peptidase (threonine type)